MPEVFSDVSIEWFIETGRRGSASSDVWDTALWDTGVWDGSATIDFRRVPESQIHSLSITSGKDRFGRRFKASSLTIDLDNRLGVYTSGLFQPGDYVKFYVKRTRQFVNIPIPDGTTWNDSVSNLWTSHGNLTLMSQGTAPAPNFMFYGRVETATDIIRGGVDVTRVVVYDVFAELGAINQDAKASQGAGEDLVPRIVRIGENASPSFGGIGTSGPPSGVTFQATTLAANALEEMQLTVESEGGDMWAQRSTTGTGKSEVEVRHRDWLTTNIKSINVWWFLGGAGLPIVDARLSRDLALLVNNATFSNTGGTSQNVTDNPSIARYGPRTTRRLDLVAENDSQAQFLAARAVANLKDIRPRVRQVTVQVIDDDTAEFAATAEFGDLTQTVFESVHGWSFATQAHIIGLRHQIGDGRWSVTVNLDDAFIDNVDGAYSSAFSDAFRLG